MSGDGEMGVRLIAGALASGTAEILTLPIDTVKVRLQVQSKVASAGVASAGAGASTPHYTGLFNCFSTIVRTESPLGLWKGLAPALTRQFVYSSLVMVIYEPVRNIVTSQAELEAKGNAVPFWKKLFAGGVAGGLSIIVANPVDVVKVRMQADVAGTRYSSLGGAMKSLVRTEGLRGMTSGLLPNIQRGFIINAAEIGSYDHAKGFFMHDVGLPDGIAAHFGASVVAGFAGAVSSNPVDVLKSRLMNQGTGKDRRYRGMVDCLTQTVRNEGPVALYNGFLANWMRKGPWCAIFFITYEKYKAAILGSSGATAAGSSA